MATRPVFIAALLAIGIALPLTLPYASGAAVAVTVGPVALEASRAEGMAIRVDPACLGTDCPIASLRIAIIDRPTYMADLSGSALTGAP
ncbi:MULTISPECIES: hypothetical protein [Maricaulis]|uniref:Uncharacterized protein n=1 Tax=Maricaulis maris (strain MCS10) TaxID=394221 RepID=Q0ALP1_MARMM|nr:MULTISPECIES: hypothetical protein [Maricaulis]ABI66802.1 hypothetical protein Mmar10_2516 [Maricaulis maris MCS10]MAC88784.1 hypothetical protein [Maricaulis sp.]